MKRFIGGLFLTVQFSSAQYESLGISKDGNVILFTSQLLLRGEENRTALASRMYRYAAVKPEVEVEAPGDERFVGAFLSTDGRTVGQYCKKTDTGFRPITNDGLCLTRLGERTFYPGVSTRISRNGRFLFQSGTPAVLRDLDTGESYPMLDLRPLHTNNLISDNGSHVSLMRRMEGDLDPQSLSLTRPGGNQRRIYTGQSIIAAAISPDSRYVFVRDDSPDGVSSLIELDVDSGKLRTIFQTVNDNFSFTLSQNASRVMIRCYQALSIWDRTTDAVRRIADSPGLIVSAIMSDDGGTLAYQRNDGSMYRIRVSAQAEPEELYSATPNMLSPIGSTAYPGSAVFFNAQGFRQDTEIRIESLNTPILRLHDTSIQTQELLLQVPWEVPLPPTTGTILVTQPGSPFLLRSQLSFPDEPTPRFFNALDPSTQTFGLTAALEDFSALVSKINPAPAGSTIHAYLGALGPLDQFVKTGQPGPQNPPAKPIAQITCELRNLDTGSAFRGLEVSGLTYAPGYVGAYQADLKIPADWQSGSNQLRCRNTAQRGDETRIFTSSK